MSVEGRKVVFRELHSVIVVHFLPFKRWVHLQNRCTLLIFQHKMLLPESFRFERKRQRCATFGYKFDDDLTFPVERQITPVNATDENIEIRLPKIAGFDLNRLPGKADRRGAGKLIFVVQRGNGRVGCINHIEVAP